MDFFLCFFSFFSILFMINFIYGGSMKNKKVNYKKNIFLFSTLFIVSLIIICLIYVNDFYKADELAISAFGEYDNVIKEELSDGTLVFYNNENDIDTGIIFYPGGKVEYSSYEPLMKGCASNGYLCAVVEMPFNLAVFDIDKADDIKDKYDNIKNWYIGGHSLGGSMAASYLEANHEEYSGLVLLGSYSTVDLSNTSLKVLSIYGSNDKVLDIDKYNKYKKNLPNDFEEHIILGGNHAYFGVYGEQDGDGKSLITNTEQINLTIDLITSLMG